MKEIKSPMITEPNSGKSTMSKRGSILQRDHLGIMRKIEPPAAEEIIKYEHDAFLQSSNFESYKELLMRES